MLNEGLYGIKDNTISLMYRLINSSSKNRQKGSTNFIGPTCSTGPGIPDSAFDDELLFYS